MNDTTKLHTEQMGKGFPVVLLHGWGHTSASVKPLAELLSQRYQVHLIDLPGFGRSSRPGEVWSSFDYAERIYAYLEERQIRHADIIGHSFGGKVALSLAINYTNVVRNLVLISASGLRRRRTIPQRLRMDLIRAAGKLCKGIDSCCQTSLFKTQIVERFGSEDYKQAGEMRPILVKSVNEDLSNKLAGVQAQTLLLWGEEDRDTPPEIAKRFHMLIPHSRLHIFPGKGHQLHQEGDGALCATYIIPFLRENGGT